MLLFLFHSAPSLFDFACFPYLQITALGERNVLNLWSSLIYFGAVVVHLLNQVLSLLWLLLLSSWLPQSHCLLLWVIKRLTQLVAGLDQTAHNPYSQVLVSWRPNSETQWKAQSRIWTRQGEYLTGEVTAGYLSCTEVGKIQNVAASLDE